MPNLDGLTVGVFGRNAALYDWPVVQVGVGPGGQPVALKINADGTLPASTGGGTQRTPAITLDTDGSHSPVAAGARSVTFIFSSDWTGTVLGQAVTASLLQLGFDAPDGDSLGAIAFTTSAGTLTIVTLI